MIDRLSEVLASWIVEDDRLTFFGWTAAAIVAMAILATVTDIARAIV